MSASTPRFSQNLARGRTYERSPADSPCARVQVLNTCLTVSQTDAVHCCDRGASSCYTSRTRLLSEPGSCSPTAAMLNMLKMVLNSLQNTSSKTSSAFGRARQRRKLYRCLRFCAFKNTRNNKGTANHANLLGNSGRF